MKTISVILIAASLLLIGCIFESQNSGNSNDLVGYWTQPFIFNITQSTYFDNKDGIDTRVHYLHPYDLDSNSCKPNLLTIDTQKVILGTWEFKKDGHYTKTMVYQIPKPNSNRGDTTITLDTTTVSREYEIKEDTLRLIINRIEGKTAFELRTFSLSKNRDTLKITGEEVSYIHGNCKILKLRIEQLIRNR